MPPLLTGNPTPGLLGAGSRFACKTSRASAAESPRPDPQGQTGQGCVQDQVDGGERGGEGQGGQARPRRRAGLRAVRSCSHSSATRRAPARILRPISRLCSVSFRVAGAATLALVIHKGQKSIQEKLNLPSQMYAFPLVVGFTVVGILILSKWGK